MSKVLVPRGASWYHELNTVAYYNEAELEREIRQHVRSLFPDFYVFPFKKSVRSKIPPGSIKKPDLAMVRRDFLAWGVIEVELDGKQVAHVLDQVRCFASGEYNAPEIADYIRGQLSMHCKKKVSTETVVKLLNAAVPQVLVIVDTNIEKWKDLLASEGVGTCLFQVYKSARGGFVYRAVGDYPVVCSAMVQVRRHESLTNLFELTEPFDFKLQGQRKEVGIFVNAQLTRWTIIEDNKKKYLQFIGKVNPLSLNSTYVLFADTGNNYHLRVN